jgi:hypothetical protein
MITGEQMFRFTSPTQPTLRVLYLIAVEGLSNNGLLNFLLQVSPTLTDLFIINCTLPRSTDDEEFAIDAVIPKMLRLKAMQTVGPGLLSVSAIARKSRENIHSLETLSQTADGMQNFRRRPTRLPLIEAWTSKSESRFTRILPTP